MHKNSTHPPLLKGAYVVSWLHPLSWILQLFPSFLPSSQLSNRRLRFYPPPSFSSYPIPPLQRLLHPPPPSPLELDRRLSPDRNRKEAGREGRHLYYYVTNNNANATPQKRTKEGAGKRDRRGGGVRGSPSHLICHPNKVVQYMHGAVHSHACHACCMYVLVCTAY